MCTSAHAPMTAKHQIVQRITVPTEQRALVLFSSFVEYIIKELWWFLVWLLVLRGINNIDDRGVDVFRVVIMFCSCTIFLCLHLVCEEFLYLFWYPLLLRFSCKFLSIAAFRLLIDHNALTYVNPINLVMLVKHVTCYFRLLYVGQLFFMILQLHFWNICGI